MVGRVADVGVADAMPSGRPVDVHTSLL
jgi:hypothetical protein